MANVLDLDKFEAKEIYSLAINRWRYGRPDQIDTSIKSTWFLEVPYKKLTGSKPRWHLENGNHKLTPEQTRDFDASVKFMREFCSMSDEEIETIIVSRSTLDAANYSTRVKKERLSPSVEKTFMERCKGKKSRMNALLSYCGHWGLVPENMTEITIVAGFEGGRRGRIGANFIKKLDENKKKCGELLAQIMKLEGISEEEPIKKIMERLG